MPKPTDIRIIGAAIYFIPVQTRVPLKFGSETLLSVICARACVRVADREGRVAEGWGETPLSVQWAWPGKTSIEHRQKVLKEFCVRLAGEWAKFDGVGHPMELGADFCEHVLPATLKQVNQQNAAENIPWLAA